MGFKERFRPVLRVARGLALSASLALVSATPYDTGHTSPRLPVASEGGEKLVKKPTVLIYHGWGGTAEGGWIGVIKEKLGKEVPGMEGRVKSRQLKQDINERGEVEMVYLEDWMEKMWLDIVETQGDINIETNSLSGPVLLKLFENKIGDANLLKIKKVRFWSPLDADPVNKNRRKGYEPIFNPPADVKKIRSDLPFIKWRVVVSRDDGLYWQGVHLAETLGAYLQEYTDQGHMVTVDNVPVIYEEIKKDLQ